MGSNAPGQWPAPHSDALAAINELFSSNYSRCAAIGRAYRMHVVVPERTPGEPAPRKPRPYKPRARKDRLQTLAPEEIALRCSEVQPRHLSFVDLEPGDCRFPFGEGPFTFCGHPKIDGSSYCLAHFHLTRKGAQ